MSAGKDVLDANATLRNCDAALETGGYGNKELGHWCFAALKQDAKTAVDSAMTEAGMEEAVPPEALYDAYNQMERLTEAAEEDGVSLVFYKHQG